MTRPLLILRPQPGADATAARATAMGLEAVVAPLFRIVPRDWDLPDAPFDALLVTSANAARAVGPHVDRGVPVYAVGDATRGALSAEGFVNVTAGHDGVAAIVRRAAADGMKRLLHLAGEDRTAFDAAGLRIETRIVYAAETAAPKPALAEALDRDGVALLHSARAARRFRELAGAGHRIAAISPAVLEAAGEGWVATAVAARPTDDALLAAAAQLCQ
jgi:uroporphyrinogen-III synthase